MSETTGLLRGRADWLRQRGKIKDAELMESAAAELDIVNTALNATLPRTFAEVGGFQPHSYSLPHVTSSRPKEDK